MHCLVIYDIENDRKRGKIADACLDYGLDRVQYSAFLGKLKPLYRRELHLKISAILDKSVGNVQLIPICETDWKAILNIENEAKA